MRRFVWLLPLAFYACSDDTEDSEIVRQITLMRVAPEDFLGTVPCQAGGGMEMYQARLVDVTPGLDEPFVLPASHLASCTAETLFQNVEPGRFYIAEIAAFDRSDISVQNPGSSIVVDDEGKSVAPRWTTSCYGDDRIDYSFGGAGGASALAIGGGTGLGAEAYFKTVTTIRGCAPLNDFANADASTALSFDVQSLLLGLQCGDQVGQVAGFSVTGDSIPSGLEESLGGAGGEGGVGGQGPGEQNFTTSCGETLTVSALEAGEELSFTLHAFEAGSDVPVYKTSCTGKPIQGVVTRATCDPIVEL